MYDDWYNLVLLAVCAIGCVAYTHVRTVYPVACGTQVVQWTGMCAECATYFL